MIIVVDERPVVAEAFAAMLKREGLCATAMCYATFEGWISVVSTSDLRAVEACLLGDAPQRARHLELISSRCRAVTIALSDSRSLEETLELFAIGFDDVVRKPVHVREILARIHAVARRSQLSSDEIASGDIKIFFNGRDPEIGGEVMQLPRRERRILECLVGSRGMRVTKSQIYNAVYGIFNEEVDENVIESHISKLRKRLRARLGYDPIESKRFLGYRLMQPAECLAVGSSASLGRAGDDASHTQAQAC